MPPLLFELSRKVLWVLVANFRCGFLHESACVQGFNRTLLPLFREPCLWGFMHHLKKMPLQCAHRDAAELCQGSDGPFGQLRKFQPVLNPLQPGVPACDGSEFSVHIPVCVDWFCFFTTIDKCFPHSPFLFGHCGPLLHSFFKHVSFRQPTDAVHRSALSVSLSRLRPCRGRLPGRWAVRQRTQRVRRLFPR